MLRKLALPSLSGCCRARMFNSPTSSIGLVLPELVRAWQFGRTCSPSWGPSVLAGASRAASGGTYRVRRRGAERSWPVSQSTFRLLRRRNDPAVELAELAAAVVPAAGRM